MNLYLSAAVQPDSCWEDGWTCSSSSFFNWGSSSLRMKELLKFTQGAVKLRPNQNRSLTQFLRNLTKFLSWEARVRLPFSASLASFWKLFHNTHVIRQSCNLVMQVNQKKMWSSIRILPNLQVVFPQVLVPLAVLVLIEHRRHLGPLGFTIWLVCFQAAVERARRGGLWWMQAGDKVKVAVGQETNQMLQKKQRLFCFTCPTMTEAPLLPSSREALEQRQHKSYSRNSHKYKHMNHNFQSSKFAEHATKSLLIFMWISASGPILTIW